MERRVVCTHPEHATKEDRQIAARKMYEILQRAANRKAQEKAEGKK